LNPSFGLRVGSVALQTLQCDDTVSVVDVAILDMDTEETRCRYDCSPSQPLHPFKDDIAQPSLTFDPR